MRKRAKWDLWPGRGLSADDIRSAAKRIAEAAPTAQETENRLRDLGRRMALVSGQLGADYDPDDVAFSARDRQVGGDHYQNMGVQPWDAMQAWMTTEQFEGFLRGNVVKYMARYDSKGGVEDLRKAQHYLEALIELVDRTQQQEAR